MNVWEVRTPDSDGNWRVCRVVARDAEDAISLAASNDSAMQTAAASEPTPVEVKMLGQDYGLERGLKSYSTEQRPPCPTCGRPFTQVAVIDKLA